MNRTDALKLVDTERDRQEHTRTLTAATPDCPDVLRLSALVEEVGEVARCLQDGTGDLCGELVQVAAVAVAWIEAFP